MAGTGLCVVCTHGLERTEVSQQSREKKHATERERVRKELGGVL